MKYNLYTKIFGFAFFITVAFLMLSFIKAVPAYADNLGCESHVFYQNQDGSVWCISNLQQGQHNGTWDNAANVINGLGGPGLGSSFAAGSFGYKSQEFGLSGGGNMVPLVHAEPLYGYTGKAECTDAVGTATGLFDCGDNPAAYVDDPTHTRLTSPYPGADLGCIQEEISINGENDDIVICNSQVQYICKDNNYLRAALWYHLNQPLLAFWCDQTSGHAEGEFGTAGVNVQPNFNPPPMPPVIDNNVDPVGHCYTSPESKYNLMDGTQLVAIVNGTVGGGLNGYFENMIPISANIVNGHCLMNGISNTALPKNTINCQIGTYYNTHQTECDCISYYNPYSRTRLANGNTYTALGCISNNFGDVINTFLSIAIGIAGAIALLMMIIGGYEIMTNPAGPDEIKEGQQYIVNAILGLLLIIFTVVVLKIIGVDILGINELAKLLGT